MIFKPPGATGYQLHQDYIGWREFPESFITVIVAIDPTDATNGATEVFPGYHRQGISRPKTATITIFPPTRSTNRAAWCSI